MPCAALKPHPATPCAALHTLDAVIDRKGQGLRILYVLKGEIGRLCIPEPGVARFAERLWQHTCCELFIARPGEPGYREFNFSPSAEWGAYEFSNYREGMGRLDVFIPIAVRQSAQRLELEASVPLHEAGELLAGVSAVIEEQGGTLSYWALKHAPGKPDFHHPDAFTLALG
jgi:hypothetical protein